MSVKIKGQKTAIAYRWCASVRASYSRRRPSLGWQRFSTAKSLRSRWFVAVAERLEPETTIT